MNVFSILFGVLFLDQFTKRVFENVQFVVIKDFFQITTAWNSGVSFSMMAKYSYQWIILLSCILIIYIIRLLQKSHKRWERAAYALILGGAIGNVLDRIFYKKVFDFLAFHYQSWHFPIFNIADIAITIGAMMIVFEFIWTLLKKAIGKK